MMDSPATTPAPKYTTAISKGAGMIAETRILLRNWSPSDTPDTLERKAQEQDLLGNATSYRTKDVVRRVFIPRFTRPDDKPARILKHILASGLPDRVFTEMLFVFMARRDPLVYDFVTQEFWPSVRRGRRSFDTDPMMSFLSAARMDGMLDNEWSDSVAIRISRCVLGLLRDIGFLREPVRGRKEVVDYVAADETIAILARELSGSGVTDSSISSHQDWGLFGLGPSEVLEKLDRVGGHDGLILQRAGSVVHITWLCGSIEELIDAIAR
jgi:hypothetical protein